MRQLVEASASFFQEVIDSLCRLRQYFHFVGFDLLADVQLLVYSTQAWCILCCTVPVRQRRPS